MGKGLGFYSEIGKKTKGFLHIFWSYDFESNLLSLRFLKIGHTNTINSSRQIELLQ